MIEKVKEIFILSIYVLGTFIIVAIIGLAIYGFVKLINRNNKNEQTSSP